MYLRDGTSFASHFNGAIERRAKPDVFCARNCALRVESDSPPHSWTL